MTDEELAMAYADAELDPISAKRLERRMLQEPALARAVAEQRALRERLRHGFAAVEEEPVPSRLTALLQPSKVVPLAPRRKKSLGWIAGGAMAASLALGLLLGQLARKEPIGFSKGELIATDDLDRALTRQLSGQSGSATMLASFRDQGGAYCRVFRIQSVGGVGCRGDDGWQVRATRRIGERRGLGEYRQAAASEAELMATAQDMMAGEPLNQEEEVRAREQGWQ